MLLDLLMPGVDGLETLARLDADAPPVVVLTSDGTVRRAVEAMRAGARDFLVKPTAPDRLLRAVRDHAAQAAAAAGGDGGDGGAFDAMVGDSAAMREVKAMARRAAAASAPVLIEGESGVGKEVLARAIHQAGSRASGPFVAVNCGALPRDLVESILFGHERGAFTGADMARAGKFEEADGGVLFLDEIGELPLDAQASLLRVVQEGEVERLGARAPRRIDARLITATNRRLADEAAAGRFREDLYYRLDVLRLTIPPLRERREDIVPLARRFLAAAAAREGRPVPRLSEACARALEAHSWPGNVRELENAMHRAAILVAGPVIEATDLRPTMAGAAAPGPATGAAAGRTGPAAGADMGADMGAGRDADAGTGAGPDAGSGGGGDEPFRGADGHLRPIWDIEADAIRAALKLYRGNVSEASRRLGLGRSTLYRKMREHGIDPP